MQQFELDAFVFYGGAARKCLTKSRLHFVSFHDKGSCGCPRARTSFTVTYLSWRVAVSWYIGNDPLDTTKCTKYTFCVRNGIWNVFPCEEVHMECVSVYGYVEEVVL